MNRSSLKLKIHQQSPEVSVMPFVNEYATEEDFEKFDLNGLWDQYHPFQKGDYYWGTKANFTIDRERNVFLMVISIGGRETPSSTSILLWINGEKVLVHLKRAAGGSGKIDARPFHIVWDFVSVRADKNCNVSQEEIFNLVREAMSVYGFGGILRQIPETVVSFNF
jgi:hypothetical protein